MVSIGGNIQEMFFVPLVFAVICGVISSLVMLSVKERKSSEKLNFKGRFTSDISGILKHAREMPEFVKFCYVNGLFEFFMSMAWPLIAITQISVLDASMLQLALLSVVQTMITIVFQGWAGRLADSVGRKPLLLFFRFSLITVPIAYALAPSIETLIIVGAFWGVSMAVGQASLTAYLIDVSKEEYRGSFIALYNLTIGVTTFFGSLLGGYLSSYTINLFGLVLGLQIVYLISTVGRSFSAMVFLTLKETLKKSL
jgi:MFS family permease